MVNWGYGRAVDEIDCGCLGKCASGLLEVCGWKMGVEVTGALILAFFIFAFHSEETWQGRYI